MANTSNRNRPQRLKYPRPDDTTSTEESPKDVYTDALKSLFLPANGRVPKFNVDRFIIDTSLDKRAYGDPKSMEKSLFCTSSMTGQDWLLPYKYIPPKPPIGTCIYLWPRTKSQMPIRTITAFHAAIRDMMDDGTTVFNLSTSPPLQDNPNKRSASNESEASFVARDVDKSTFCFSQTARHRRNKRS